MGVNNDVWTDGEHQEYIPGHVEINEMLARAIIRRIKKGS
ncbi:hypothetical protein S225a_09620 [Candidatus Brocadiaceae bacterium S225]|nr:hypothetical protein S225a_09620 [Candidatus Brocadiaceae bacterium S225]